MKNCPLCHKLTEYREKDEILFENDHFAFVFLDSSPIAGQGIIAIKTHKKNLLELNDSEWSSLRPLINEVQSALSAKYKTDSFNIGYNDGKLAGDHFEHFFVYIIPRYTDEAFAGRGLDYYFRMDENKRGQDIQDEFFLDDLESFLTSETTRSS